MQARDGGLKEQMDRVCVMAVEVLGKVWESGSESGSVDPFPPELVDHIFTFFVTRVLPTDESSYLKWEAEPEEFLVEEEGEGEEVDLHVRI